MDCFSSALLYASMGWQVIPLHSIQGGKCTCKNPSCTAPGKHPLTPHGLQDASIDPIIIDGWWNKWPQANVGIVTGTVSGIIVLDIDPRHFGDDTLSNLIIKNGQIPDTLETLTGGGGRHILFKHPGRKVPNDSRGAFFGQGIDVRGDGGYIVAPPSNHISGKQYLWEASCDPAIDLIAIMPGWVDRALPKISSSTSQSTNGNGNNGNGAKPSQPKKVKAGMRNTTLTSMAGAMRRKGMPQTAIEAALLDTNKELCDPPLPDADVLKIAKSVGRYTPTGSTPTDDELATEWITKYPETLFGLGEWRRYNGKGIWPPIPEKKIEEEVLDIAIDAKGQGFKPTYWKIKSIMELAKMQVDTPQERWNANSEILVCKNGTLEIEGRILRSHQKDDYITTGVPYNYDKKADQTFWIDFLNSTIPDASDFLREFAGYALTTDTQYEMAIWLYGPRGCGKSTFIEGIKSMLGTRAGQLGLAQIENSRFGLAGLQDKTLLFSTEQPSDYIRSGHILNSLISGEELVIERKFKDQELLTPYAKILWAMNDLPRIKEASSGLFRRVKVVEWPHLKVTPDPTVKTKIKFMGAAILNWALDGLDELKRQRGFDVPKCVQDATRNFQEVNDVVKIFIDEVCELGNFQVKSSTLYEHYRAWCDENGHKPKSNTALSMEDWHRMGFVKSKLTTGNYWHGLRIKP
jgi:putative DNA primase/helicase